MNVVIEACARSSYKYGVVNNINVLEDEGRIIDLVGSDW